MKIYFEEKPFEANVILEENGKKLIEVEGDCPITGLMPCDIKKDFPEYKEADFDLSKTYIIENGKEVKYY